jgi:hypothetical protein
MKGLSKFLLPASIIISALVIAVALNIFYTPAAEFSVLETWDAKDQQAPSGFETIQKDYMTSTSIALEVPETRRFNIEDFAVVRWETASEVWSYGATGITIKDSDSDGYIDWVIFTATGGATAGGRVEVLGFNHEGMSP